MQKFDKVHSDWIGCVVVSKTSLFLFSCGGDKKIVQWKAIEGKLVHEFDQHHTEGIYTLALNNEEDILFSGSGDK